MFKHPLEALVQVGCVVFMQAYMVSPPIFPLLAQLFIDRRHWQARFLALRALGGFLFKPKVDLLKSQNSSLYDHI